MALFARIEAGVVAELFSTEQAISDVFHAGMAWVDTAGKDVAVGFRHVEGAFFPPAPETPAPAPDKAALQAQIAALAAQVAALV